MRLAQDPGRIRDLARALAAGKLTSVALVEQCLARIAEVDPQVKAWLYVLREPALAEARARDAETRNGQSRGPLHGIPVAVKDVIDVAGLPTRANSRSRDYVGPATADATVVAHLRAAGAVILGKVHTTEYAYFEGIPPTRNPHDLTRTPGGSSIGSAAAVASGTVPLALGTQTAGSVNRPAAYTGIGAFKPSTLSIGGTGIIPLAPSFDTCGAFGATAQDAVLLASGFAPDHLRLHIAPADAQVLRIIKLQDAMLTGRTVAATAERVAAFARKLSSAGLEVVERQAPVPLEEVLATHRRVMLAELGRTHSGLPADKLAPRLAADIITGRAIPDAEYHAALGRLTQLRRQFWAGVGRNAFVLMPAAPDVAPADGTTGDPSYVIPTTALGGPVATVAAGPAADTRMPVGVLLFAEPGADARLAGFLRSDIATALDL